MTYKNQTEYLKTDIEKILAQHIRVVEENMKRITGKNKDDIQKNLSVSLDQLKKDMTSHGGQGASY
jgi:gas vesicle protein